MEGLANKKSVMAGDARNPAGPLSVLLIESTQAFNKERLP
jgi:hypothetical protein